MEPSWSERFLNHNGQRKASPIVLVFAALQLIIIVVILITVSQLSDNKTATNDAERYERMPELTIKDLTKKVSILSKKEITDIQKKVFKIVSENSSNISVDKIEATIRDDSLHVNSFSEKTKYLNMIVDIPSLEQSYELVYGSNAVIDPDVSTFVLCLDDDEEVVYKNFECKSSDNPSIREKIVSNYLSYFKFNYFSAYIDSSKDSKTIVINPSVTYDNSEETKTDYINEVKDSVYSLGISPEKYKYHVRTADEVNYENND